MKNKVPRIRTYSFTIKTEITSCYNCPCHDSFGWSDEGKVKCNILEKAFALEDNQFPEDCPMWEDL